MQAILINEFGGADMMTYEAVALPAPQAEEVLVRVEAAGVNPLDVKIIAGYMQSVFPVTLPYIPGTDFSGVIEAVGHQVDHLKPGDRVVGRTSPNNGGAFARNLIIAAAELSVIPAQMSFEQAATLPTSFGTAQQALFDVGQLQAKQRVFIHAGAGGVGSMAVQLAHHQGCHVIATASAHNTELVKSLGADEVIDYRTQTLDGVHDIDLVLDTIGGDTLAASWSTLRPGGRIVSLVDFNIAAQDGHPGEFVFFATATPYLPEAIQQFSAGRLQTVIDSSFKLSDARMALEKIAAGHARGKILIRPHN